MSDYDTSLNSKLEKLIGEVDILNWKMERIIQPSDIEDSLSKEYKLPTLNLTLKQMRSKVMMKISDEMKCTNCGCDDIRLLEIHHTNNDGKNDRNAVSFYKRILLGLRKVDDLELLCKVCNWTDFVQFKYGTKGYKIKFDPLEP